jgi:hypothetical protein
LRQCWKVHGWQSFLPMHGRVQSFDQLLQQLRPGCMQHPAPECPSRWNQTGTANMHSGSGIMFWPLDPHVNTLCAWLAQRSVLAHPQSTRDRKTICAPPRRLQPSPPAPGGAMVLRTGLWRCNGQGQRLS